MGYGKESMKKLHLGCGTNYIKEWINIDRDSKIADKRADLTKGLPYSGNTVSYIYSEHFIEHLYYEEKGKDSNSRMKYNLSRLDSLDVAGKTCLDVGCNAGYFIFKLKERGAGWSTGIDLGEKFIRVAKALCEGYFRFDALEFICGDFFEYYLGIKYDLVLCLSTFHYFGMKQEDFLVDVMKT